jgi:hypothetical protein
MRGSKLSSDRSLVREQERIPRVKFSKETETRTHREPKIGPTMMRRLGQVVLRFYSCSAHAQVSLRHAQAVLDPLSPGTS